MKRQWLVVTALSVLILALVAVGWLARERFAPLDVGGSAPDFSARDLDGQPVSFGDHRGEVVLLNIWATWCDPCREEMPSMQRLHDLLAPEGLRIVAVSVDREVGILDGFGNPGGDIRAFAAELGLSFMIWHDPSGAVQRRYRATAVPESFVIDHTGVIIRKKLGEEAWDSEANVQSIRRLLAHKAESALGEGG